MSTILSSQSTNDDDARIKVIIKATTPYRRKAFAEKLHALHSMDKTVTTRVKIVEIIPAFKNPVVNADVYSLVERFLKALRKRLKFIRAVKCVLLHDLTQTVEKLLGTSKDIRFSTSMTHSLWKKLERLQSEVFLMR